MFSLCSCFAVFVGRIVTILPNVSKQKPIKPRRSRFKQKGISRVHVTDFKFREASIDRSAKGERISDMCYIVAK